jgi:hypothetical protein
MAPNGRVNFLPFSGHTAPPFGKIGMQPHTLLKTTTPASPALALDRRYTNEWHWNTQMVILC